MPEDFISTELFDAHVKESDYRHQVVVADVKDLRAGLDNRVTYQSFTWILGILITIFIAVFLFIANQMKDIQLTTNDTKNVVSQIKGKLEPFNIEFKQ